jgi:hypothetical protein
MPAKKSTTAAAAAQPGSLAMPATAFQPGFQFAPMAAPQFQFAAPTGFQFGSVQPGSLATAAPAAPQFAPIPMAPLVPSAQPVAVPQPITQSTVNPVELLEAQMKAMKEYVANMEKTLKDAKKGMKKPRVPKDPNAPKNPIPEGTQAWNDFVVLVQKEESDRIRSTDPTKGADWKGITRKDAMAKAKELKAAGDPRYNYVKKEKPASPTLAATAAPAAPGAPVVEAKKRGRKPKAPPASPALPPTAAVPTIPNTAFSFPTFATALPAATASEETLEVEETTINGQTYLITSKNECWHMLPNGDQGQWAGIYNGSIIVPTPEPSC